MPIEIAVQTTGGEVRVTVFNNQRTQNFDFVVANQPTSVTLDPDQKVLRNFIVLSGAGPLPLRTDILSVYPNPVRRTFSLEYATGEAGAVEVEVFDVAGRRVLSKSTAFMRAGTRSEVFDASSLSAGVYFVRLRAAAGTTATRKFVVLR